VPDKFKAESCRALAHASSLSPDDEMLRIREAVGTLALLARHTSNDIAEERERFQELLELHRHSSAEVQKETLGYVHELETRIAAQVEYANKPLTRSLENQVKTIDSLLRKLRGNLLRIWIPLAFGASLLADTSCGMEILPSLFSCLLTSVAHLGRV
jgi:hypothetical protein